MSAVDRSDPTRRFADQVEAYTRSRPGYPPQLLDELERAGALGRGGVVADVGSGTGKLTVPLVERGHRVYAVEPDPAMRAAAESLLAGRPGCASVDGRAEATGLEAGSVDVVTVAQAFHWFDRPRARVELARILRPGGRIVLVWNDRVDEASAFTGDYERLLQAHGIDYGRVDHRQVDEAAIAAFFAPVAPRHLVVRHAQSLDREGLRDRVLSCSYIPGPGEPGHAAVLAATGALFERHARGGRVELVYDARAWWSRLLDPVADA